jgi:hypothetical protein
MNHTATVEAWAAQARQRLQNGGLTETDIDALLAVVHANGGRVRQRLLYLHAVTPSIRSKVIGMALHEPIPGSVTQITAQTEWPYATVHEAILDGWQVISFPQQRVPFDDREIDVLGYEFILQKMEGAANA